MLFLSKSHVFSFQRTFKLTVFLKFVHLKLFKNNENCVKVVPLSNVFSIFAYLLVFSIILQIKIKKLNFLLYKWSLNKDNKLKWVINNPKHICFYRYYYKLISLKIAIYSFALHDCNFTNLIKDFYLIIYFLLSVA